MIDYIEEKPKQALLFLDIDGVLNSLSTAIAFGKQYKDHAMSPVSVGLLKSLCESTGALIILTSSKRRHFSSNEDCIAHYIKLFRDHYNWDNFPIIGRTPRCGSVKNNITQENETRGYEVDAWLKDNGSKVYFSKNYVILDDDSDFKAEQRPRLVKTSFANGFDFVAYNKALNILGYGSPSFTVMCDNTLAHYKRQ